MKIDLHCHTKSGKCGDGMGCNVAPDLFRRLHILEGSKEAFYEIKDIYESKSN